MDLGRAEFAAVANAIAQFEPVTMVCASLQDEAVAKNLLTGAVTTIVEPMDGSWLRDNGPIFVTAPGQRKALQFRFNAWGERHAHRDRDAALGATLARHLETPVTCVDVVLEGGAIATDGAGSVVTTTGCTMHLLRNWQLPQEEVEKRLLHAFGADRIIWLPQGLERDLDRTFGTDGHIDLFFDFVAPRKALMLSVPQEDANYDHLCKSKDILAQAGIEVIDFPYMATFSDVDRQVIAPYLNFYVCNGAVVVPVAGEDRSMDSAALTLIGEQFPEREIVPVAMRAAPRQGGAVHCLTQQVPAIPQ
jgi:agmatine deiminase